MSLSLQNLRAVIAGAEPSGLLPGQICFNLVDKILFVGDGSNTKTRFDGTSAPGITGEGWYSMPMDFSQLSTNFIVNPEVYGDIPTDGQVLTWDQALGHTTWTNGGSTNNLVYTTTNIAVAAAPGGTLTAKINSAIGVSSPDPYDWTVVTGLPGDIYQGVYYYTTQWNKAANYAWPEANQIPYNNTVSGLTANDVQEAVDELDTLVTAAQSSANAANAAAGIAQDAADAAQSTADQAVADAAAAQATADAALPRSGGTMTGPLITETINTQQVNVGTSYGITFANGANGSIFGISNNVGSTSTVFAASSAAVKIAKDAADSAQVTANAAVPRSSYTAPGSLVVGTGAGTFNSLPAGPADYILSSTGLGTLAWVAQSEGDVTSVTGVAPITVDNTDSQNPVVGVNLATTSAPGVVQVELTGNINIVDGVINVPDASTTVKGAVALYNGLNSSSPTLALTAAQGQALQDQIDTLTLSNSVILAGGYNATTGLVDGVTSQGTLAGFTDGQVPPTAGAGNVDHYLIATTAGSNPSAMQNGDWLLSVETAPLVYAYQVLGVGARPATASYNTVGVVQLADGAAVLAGTSDNTAITPQALQDNIIDSVTTINSSQMASATAVNTAYVTGTNAQATANSALATANAALPRAGGTMTGNITFQNAGEGIVFNGGSQVFAISNSTSTTSSTTAASSTAVKAAYDVAAAAIPCAVVTNLGDILATNALGVPTALPLGLNGQVLVVNTACTTGLEWVSDTPGDVTSVTGTSPITVDNTDPQNPIVSIDAATLVSCGAVQLSNALNDSSDSIAATAGAICTTYNLADLANTTANAAIPCASFLAKGNLLGGTSAGNFSALSVGTNGQVLIADSACTTGLKWGNACYVPDACFTAAGQIIVGTGAGTYVALPVGTDCQTLVVNSACTATGGVTWGVSLSGYTCAVADGNTALGQGAGDSITTGLHNTAIGSCAGTAISAGDNNTFVGWCTGDGLTSGNNNTAVGALAFGNTGGSNNTIMGYCAGAGITTGNSNTLVGSNAGDAIAGGNSIVGVGQGVLGGAVTAAGTVAIGATAGAALTSGANTTLVGFAAGDSITSGARNTVVGHTSGGAITTGADNTIIGALAGNLTTGTGSTILGSCAGAALTLGGANVFLGAGAGDLVTTGFNNTIIGDVGGSTTLTGNAILAAGTTVKFQANNAGAWSYNGTDFGTAGQFLASQGSAATPVWCTLSLACVPCAAYTAVGDILVGTGASTFSALPLGTSGQALVVDTACASGVKWTTASGLNLAGFTCSATPFNTALGALAGDSITSGTNNTTIGYGAGTGITSGTNNTFVGTNTGDLLTNGNFNTALGAGALGAQTGGNNNTAIGASAGDSVTTGADNTFVGQSAGNGVTTASGITAVGYLAGRNAASGTTAVGCRSLQIATGAGNTAVGLNTGACVTTGINNTSIGCGALQAATTGGSNTIVGSGAGTGITTQDGHVAIGSQTLVGTLDINNLNLVAVGTCALRAVTSGQNNIGIGFCAGALITTGGCNIAIGARALDSVTTSANNIGIGFNALTSITTGSENLAIGTFAGDAITTGTDNIAIGYNAGTAQAAGAQSVFIGTGAGQASDATGVTAIGFCAAQANTTAGCGTYLGFVSGRNATGVSNTYIGALTGCAASNTSACGTLLGFCAGSALTTGNGNTFLGFNSGRFVTTGGFNVALGTAAFQTATSATNNVAIGCGALAGLTTTSGNTALGHRAMLNASSAANNVVIGCSAGEQISTGSTNVFIGNTAGDAVTTGSSNTIIGDIAGSTTLANNLILAAGTTIKLQVNENGAVGVGSTPSYGTAGQVLQSAGTAAAPTWTTPVWQPLTTLTTTSTTATTLLSVPVASTRAVFIDISVSDVTGGNYHTDSYQVVTDGTVTDDQQIAGARIGTNPYTLTSAVVGANLVISVTSSSANSTKYVGSYQTIAV